MKRSSPESHAETYGIDEVEVELRIREGKITARSQSGPKSGSIRLGVDDMAVDLVLEGAGSDRATASLSVPELANFRTIVNAVLSAVVTEDDESTLDSSTIYSGYRTLRSFDDGVGTTFDAETLRRLNLVDETGDIPGGNRQIRCTVLGNGTAILNLADDRGDRTDGVGSGFDF